MKSKMTKKFDDHAKRGLRCMADGLVSNRMQRDEMIAGAQAPVSLSANPATAPFTPQPVAPAATTAPAPVSTAMTPQEVEMHRKLTAPQPVQAPSLMDRARRALMPSTRTAMADGGMVDDIEEFADGMVEDTRGLPRKTPEQIAAEAGFSTQPTVNTAPAAPLVQPQRTLRDANTSFARQPLGALKIRQPQGTMGVRGADGGTRAEMIKRSGLRGAMRASDVHEGPGMVRGKGGPTDDQVNAKLSPGESVIPADTTAAVGEENINALILATHDFKDPKNKDAAVQRFNEDNLIHAMDGEVAEGELPKRVLRWQTSTAAPSVAAPAVPPPAAPATPALGGNPYNTRPPITKVTPEAARYVQQAGQVAKGGGFIPPSAPAVPAGAAPVGKPGMGAGGSAAAVGVIGGLADTLREQNTDGLTGYADKMGFDMSTPGGALATYGTRALQNIGNFVTGGIADRVGNAVISADEGEVDFGHSPVYSSSSPASQQPNLRNPDFSNVVAGHSSSTTNAPAQPTDWEGRGAPLQTREGRESQLRAAYAPTQYAGKSLEQMGDEQRAKAFGPDGELERMRPKSFGEEVMQASRIRGAKKQANIDKTLQQRENDSIRQYGASAARDQVTLRGQDMTAKSAKEAGARDQANKDRQYNMDVAKYGTDVAEKNRAAMSAADDHIQKGLQSRFRTSDKDGKDVADTAKIAEFTTAMSKSLPSVIAKLEATKNPEAIKRAKQIRERGAAALGPEDMDALHTLFDVRQRSRDAKGWGPNQGSHVESDDLLDYSQTGSEHRTFGGDRVKMRGGSSVSRNDLRYDTPANKVLPDWFKGENTNLSKGFR